MPSPVLSEAEAVVERLWKIYLVDILGKDESEIPCADDATETYLASLREAESRPAAEPAAPAAPVSRAA